MATSKKIFKLDELKPGMVFSAPVFIDEQNLLIRSFEPLKKSDIEKLLRWGIDKVYTEGDLVTQANMGFDKKADTQEKPESKDLLELEEIKMHKEFAKLKETKEDFVNRTYQMGNILKKNFKDLWEKKQFNNHELLTEALFLTNSIIEYRFFPLLLMGARFSDDPIIHHSIHSASYGGFLGKLINLNKIRIQELVFSIMIMDVGMYFIPIKLRQKNTILTEEEKKMFYTHTLYSYKVLTENAYVKQSLALVSLQHHENFDGSGYPKKIKEQEISLLARIAAVVDRYTAMLEDRYHRKSKIPYEAMKILLSHEGNHLDPRILKFFVGGLSAYPVGSFVELSNHFRALVIEGNLQAPLRPFVKLVFDDKKNFIKELKILNLSKQPNITITKVLDPVEEKVQIQQLF
ncbi:MAG: HD-GYP domain-containing protein [Leptonema sp. (in: bacteria)]